MSNNSHRADSASYDEMWNALTPAERERFLRALDDPHSELAQQLLASEDLEKEQIEPWWEAAATAEVEDPTGSSSTRPPKRRHGGKPTIMPIPEPLVKQSSHTAVTGPLLLYNLIALWYVVVP